MRTAWNRSAWPEYTWRMRAELERPARLSENTKSQDVGSELIDREVLVLPNIVWVNLTRHEHKM